MEWGFQRCDGCIHKVGGMTWWMRDTEDLTVGSSRSAVFHASSLSPQLKTATGTCVKLLSAAGRWVLLPPDAGLIPRQIIIGVFFGQENEIARSFSPPPPPPKPACSTEFSRGWGERMCLSTHPHQRQPQQGKGASRGVTTASFSELPGHLSALTGLTSFPSSVRTSVSPTRQAQLPT